MGMDKTIALAVNFSKAPKELQDAAIKSADLGKRIEKLQRSIPLAQAEIERLTIEQGVVDKEFRAHLKAWDPAEDKVKP